MTQSIAPDQLLAFIESRQSVGQLVEPAPTQAQLEQALQAALSAPDHHRLRPWQFLQVRDEGRHALGQIFLQCVKEAGVTESAQLERALAQPLRAPLILVAIVDTQQHPKVPKVEQVLSMGAAIENFLLMLNAQGYAAMWRTGTMAESGVFKQKMGLKAEDEVAGFIYIGTAARQLAPRERLPVNEFLTDWPANLL
jgi:nitroreductase